MPRTLEAILTDQRITMADLVKGARLNSQLLGATFVHGAETIAQCLTDDEAEIEMLQKAIVNSVD